MKLRQISYYIMMILLFFAPLAFGAVETWSVMIMELLIMSCAFIYSLHMVIEKKPFYSVPGLFPLVILCEFILLQIIPLPESLVKLISPASWELYQNSSGIFNEPHFMTISVDKAATMSEFLRFLSCTVFYVFSVQILSEKTTVRSTIKGVSFFGAALAFSSICQMFLTKDHALWFRYIPYNSMIVGPYICHNHYAGLMEMIFPLALALFIYNRPSSGYGTIRERIIHIFENPATAVSLRYFLYCLLIAVSIFLSLSRGGIISLCVGTIFFFFLYSIGKNKKYGLPKAGILTIFVIISVSWFGWEDIAARFSHISTNEIEGGGYSRLSIWEDTLPMIDQFALTGSGFGSYRSVFPAFQTFYGQKGVDHAHNDYLEFTSTGGFISVILIMFFLVSIFISARKIYLKRRDRFPAVLYIAALSGIISILVHSLFDFNMQIPANMLYFTFLCSILVAGSAVRIKNITSGQTFLKTGRSSGAWVLLIFTMLTFFLILAFQGSRIASEIRFSGIRNINVDQSTNTDTLKNLYSEALRSHLGFPFEPSYSFACAKLLTLLGDNDSASVFFEKALDANPADTGIMMRAAKFFLLAGNKEKAEKMMESSIQYNKTGFEEHKSYAERLFDTGKKVEAMKTLGTILSFYNGDIRKFLAYIDTRFHPEKDVLVSVIPQKSNCWRSFGEYMLSKNDTVTAEMALLKSTGCDDSDHRSFLAASDYYIKNKNYDMAIQLLKKAGEKFPDNTAVMEKAAFLYESTGVSYRAMEEYRKILLIDPGNKKARKGLGIIK